MKHYYLCSLCKGGILGGGLIVDENTITFKTGKLTVDDKLRNLQLRRDQIVCIEWKRRLFPFAILTMQDGSHYTFLIFSKRCFVREFV